MTSITNTISQPIQELEQQRRQWIARRLSLWSALSHFTWILVAFFVEEWGVLTFLICSWPLYFIAFFLLHRNHYLKGGYVLVLTMQGVIFGSAGMVGQMGHPEIMLGTCTGLPFILFNVRTQAAHAIGLSVFSVLAYITLQMVDFQVVFWDEAQDAHVIAIVRYFGMITLLGILSIQFYFLITGSNRYMDRLDEAAQRLKEKDRAKEEFMAHISHELRTPLNAINGLAHLMEQKATDEDKQRLGAIRDSGKQMLRLINEILDVSKFSGKEISPSPVVLHLGRFARKLEQNFAAETKSRKNEMQVMPDLRWPCVWVDESYLTQIANNLISNALKFTSDGVIRVEIGVEMIGSARYQLQLRVIDTGLGIPLFQQQRIFEPFEQGSRERSLKYGGTGLGLPIARGIAQGMGGRLELVRSWPKHTEFLCTVPVDLAQEEQEELEVFEPKASLSGKRILVVDDHEINRMVIEQFFKHLESETILVESGEQAIERCQNESFDIILLDLRMPGIDGFETARILREQGFSQPIVALSASTFADIAERLQQSGINDFQMKPFQPNELLEKIVGWLRA